MIHRYISRICLIFICLTATMGQTPTPNPADENSYANFDQIRIQDLHITWNIDFDAEVISGGLLYPVEVIAETDTVYFDVSALEIEKVRGFWPDTAAQDLPWEILYGNPNIGDALKIDLGSVQSVGQTFTLVIEYKTTSGSMALSWLLPEQTSSKTMHFMYTQCESIFARTLAPLQDSPSVKATYSASVSVPIGYIVVMSGTLIRSSASQLAVFEFEQTRPIPSYLIAIAVGYLEYQQVGARTGIYAEPTILQSALDEYEDLETFLDTTEEYMTTYQWDTYNLLFLPPSFPYGGMENPLATFYNPVLITGDKSLTNIATHEISHSWTGNYVTCADWANLWLNEGFTTFEERKVSGILYGEDFRLTEFYVGSQDLYAFIDSVGPDSQLTSLNPIFNGDNPDLYTTNVPYEKGSQFVFYLESILGSDAFQDFLQAYLNNFAWQSIYAEQLQEFWEDYITQQILPVDPETAAAALAVDWDAWVFSPGYPPVKIDFSNAEVEAALDLAEAYIQLLGQDSPDYSSYETFNNNQKLIFLNELLARTEEINLLTVQRIDMDLSISKDPNPTVKFRWQSLGIQFHYEAVLEYAHEYVTTSGRTKWIKPVYESLVKYGYRHLAYEWMKEAETFYHPITLSQLQATLLKDQEPAEIDLRNIPRYEEFVKHKNALKQQRVTI